MIHPRSKKHDPIKLHASNFSGDALVAALLLALPVGVAAGRWLWTAFAGELGVVVEPAVPLLLLAAAVLVTLTLGLGASLVPATLARRARPGRTLRTE